MNDATILVADDHDSLRSLVRMMLTRTDGWTVVEAADGTEALRRSLEHVFDLLILDQRMPGLTGTEVSRRLRDEHFDGPIVLFSAYLDPDVEEEAERLGLITLDKFEISRLPALAGQFLTAV